MEKKHNTTTNVPIFYIPLMLLNAYFKSLLYEQTAYQITWKQLQKLH